MRHATGAGGLALIDGQAGAGKSFALEQLLGAPCYHMTEVFLRPDDIAVWQAAVDGAAVDWLALMDGYAATVDWPGAAFWPALTAAPITPLTSLEGTTSKT